MIVDARNRAPHPAFDGLSDLVTTRRINEQYGLPTPPSFERGSMGLWRDELAEAGVDAALIVGRATASWVTPLDVVAALQDEGDGVVVGVAGIDVVGQVHDPVEELARCLARGIFTVAIDPGTGTGIPTDRQGVEADDERVVELCVACADEGVAIVCLTGPYSAAGPRGVEPSALDRLLERCSARGATPTIVASHGCYPSVDEALAVARRWPNLHLCPDLYVCADGGERYLRAVEGPLADQLLFGSAYPYADPASLLFVTRDAVAPSPGLDRYLGGNAARVFARSLAHLGHDVGPPATAPGRSAPGDRP